MTDEEQMEMFNAYYMAGYPSREVSTTPKPTYAELEKENAELKADNDARRFAMAMSEKVEKKLRKENAELKKDKEELCHSISEGGKACVYLNDQLTNAKEIIRDFISVAIDYIDKEDKNYSYIVEAEQFLNSEVEK